MKLLFVNFVTKDTKDAGTKRIDDLYLALENKISVKKIYLDLPCNFSIKFKLINTLLSFPASFKILYKLLFDKRYKDYNYLWFWPINYNYLWVIPILRLYGKKIIFDYNDDFYELSNNNTLLLKIKSVFLYKIPQIITPYISNYVLLTPYRYKLANNYIKTKSLSLTTGFNELKFYHVKKNHSQKKEIKIGYFGSIKSEFDLDFILNAIIKTKYKFKLYLFGWNKDIVIPKDSRIKYMGVLSEDDVNTEINNIDILLCPFKYGNLANYASPVKIFEYMACGKAILCANVESIKGILKHEDNCLLYRASNERDFILKLRLLLQDSELRNKLSIKALRDSKKYTWIKISEKVINYIKHKN